MKIEIDIPDTMIEEGRHIYIMAGMEPVAYKLPDKPWVIKTSKCSMCGRCCSHVRDKDYFPQAHNGVCDYLVQNECSLGTNRPFGCCVSVFEQEGCSISWKVLEK